MTSLEFIKSENNSHQVVVWSKSYCPYCQQTKKLFESMEGVDVVVHELDEMKGGFRYQQDLYRLTGQRTVPNVFVNGQHVGGNDDTQHAHKTGILDHMLYAEVPEKM